MAKTTKASNFSPIQELTFLTPSKIPPHSYAQFVSMETTIVNNDHEANAYERQAGGLSGLFPLRSSS